jgi:tRNA splicing endonuclease
MPKEKKETEEKKQDTEQKKERVKSNFFENSVVTINSDLARELYNQSRYGELKSDGKVSLSLIEGLYLVKVNFLDENRSTEKFFNHRKSRPSIC